jgi:hypothetical protein
MSRGFLGLLLIVGAVAALAQENSAAAQTARPAQPPDRHRSATGSTISIGNLEIGTHICGD